MPTRRPQQPGAVASASPGINAPFQGYFNDRPPHVIEPSGFSACNNVRVRFNQIWFKDMGWRLQVPGATTGVTPLYIPSGDTPSIIGGGLFTLTGSIYQYLVLVTLGGDIYAVAYTSPASLAGVINNLIDPTAFGGHAVFITPVYDTAQASCAGTTAVTGIGGTLWNTASGTGFRNNVRPGDFINFDGSQTSNPAANWFKVLSVTDDTHLTLTSAGPNTGGGTNYTIRQRLNPNLTTSRVSCETFPNNGDVFPYNYDLFFITDGGGQGRLNVTPSVDPILAWNPTLAFAKAQTSFSFTCKQLRRFNNVMVYGNLWGVSGLTPTGPLGATSFQSSDNGKAITLSGGVTFQGVVSDGAEPIQHLGVMGNQLLVYTGGEAPADVSFSMSPGQGGSVISASFVGFPTIWQFATVVRGRGTIGQGLVAEFADRHQFIAQDGEYRYNGMFLQIMNDHVFRGVLAALDWGNLQSAFHIIDPQAGELIWVLPTSVNAGLPVGNPNNNLWACYVEHYMEQANNYLFKPITIRDAEDPTSRATGVTWQCFLGAIPNKSVLAITGRQGPLVGDSGGNVIQIGLGVGDYQTWGSGSAQAITETCTFAARIVAGERARGLVKRVYPFVDEVDSSQTVLTVELDLADRVGAALSAITDTQTYTTGTATRFTTHYRRGRVAQIKFTQVSTGAGTPGVALILDGYDWDLPRGSPGGQR